MRTTIAVSILLLVHLVFSSCNKKNKAVVESIDSISAVLEKSATAYLKLDTALIRSDYATISSNIRLLNGFEENKMDKDESKYRRLYKPFKRFLKENPLVLKELDYTRQQLISLNKDAEEGVWDEQKLMMYLEQESNACQAIQYKMNSFSQRMSVHLNTFNTLNPKMVSLIDSLSQSTNYEE